MPIHIYHPNKNNSGFACSFSQSGKDGTIFATLIKQSGWNAETQVGTFKDSKNDPTKNINVKLGQVEVAAILDCLDRSRPFSTVHDSDKSLKAIKFEPWLDRNNNNTPRGYSFSMTLTDKENPSAKVSLYIGLTFPEGRLIREYLMFALQNSFNNEVKVVADAF